MTIPNTNNKSSTSNATSNTGSGKSYTWTCSAFLKIILFTLTLNITPTTAKATPHPRVGKNENTSKKQVCYKGYGCFKNDPPFNPDMPLPLSAEKLGTVFQLQTREHPSNFNITNHTDISLSTFNATRPTKVLIHGFVLVSEEIAEWVPSMAEALLGKENVNVILVNWVKGAKVQYDQAVANTRMIGAQIHNLLMYLVDNHQADPRNFHLIGFSLGAHVAGFAGKQMRKAKNKIGRISGLDPANPAFNHNSSMVRLDKTDARFVDVIHTDIRTLLHISSGLNRSIGHIDFWPNGGESQPGCHNWNGGFFKAVSDMAVCDHLRAPKLYQASITTEVPMIGYRCPSYDAFRRGACLKCKGTVSSRSNNRCNVMGYYAKPPRGSRKDAQVDYYLDTSDRAPFALRHYQIQIHWRKVEGKTTDNGLRVSLFARLHGEHMSSDVKKLYLHKDESSKSYHLFPNRTARFLISLPHDQELGSLNKVQFWWNRQTCWHVFGCNDENVFVKRIKVLDAVNQKRYVFVTKERLSHEGVGPREIPDGEKVMFEKLERNKKRHDHHRRRTHNKSQVEGDGRIVMVEPPVRVPTIVRRAAVVPTTSSSSPAIAA